MAKQPRRCQISNIQRIDNLKQIVQLVQPQFEELAKIHNAVNFKQEASFALQILADNPYVAEAALADQDSFKRAIINVASIGLSLSPMKKHAYLIPRKKRIVLDLSYLGLVQLAIECGAVKWVAAEIVREKDKYIFKGVNEKPVHEFDPFSDRGEVKGAYCLAKTHDGEFILTQMNAEEILSIRDRSESFKSGKNSPWISDENEMIKKTVIRRASKSWPMVDTRANERLVQAIDATSDFDPEAQVPLVEAPKEDKRAENLSKITEMLKELGRTEDKFIAHINRVNRRNLKAINEMTEIESGQAVVMLTQLVGAKKKTEVKNADS